MNCLSKRIRALAQAGALLLLLTATGLWAQSTAQISGKVTDQTGAVLPGVEVTVTQTATGAARSALTDETGSYTLTSLPVGPYKLEASLSGFRTYAQTGIILQVGSNPTVNAVMQVGQVTETVEVQADAALVETRSTSVGQVIDNQRVLELPLNARQVTELIVLSGAAIGGGAQATNRNYPTQSISVGGGLNNGLTYVLDGGTHNDPFNNLNLPLPFPDALQEFKVETSAAPAQYGEHSSGAVNLVTKSGTNTYHGDLFEFVRNNVFNARNAFALRRDGLKRNQFGGVVGGPIKKNKMFFFGGYQGTIERAQPTDNRSFVPTAQMLAGDFTTVTSTACRATALTLKGPFVGNKVDPSVFSPQALNMVKLLPVTTDPCGLTQYGRVTNNDEKIVASKVDYQWNEKHSLFGRYQLNNLFTPTDYDGHNILSSSQGNYHRRIHSFVLGDTYLVGSGIVNSFHGTVNRVLSFKTMEGTGFPFATFGDLGVKGIYQDPELAKVPQISVTSGFAIHSAPGLPGFTNSTVFQFSDDMSVLRGAHQIGFGADFINRRMNVKATSHATPNFTFDVVNSGLGLADFLLGLPSDFSQGLPNAFYFRQNYYGLYLQDTWKASRKLTVNAGLRWEPFRAPYDKQKRVEYFTQQWFDQGVHSTVYTKAPAGLLFPGDPGVPDGAGIGPNHTKRFAPRLGLSFDPSGNGKMVVRAAYGIFTDYPHFYQYGGYRDQPPWGSVVDYTNPPSFGDPWQGYPGGNPFPIFLNKNIPFPPSSGFNLIPLDFKMPYVNQWNLSVQRQIGADWLVAGNYIGSSLIHFLIASEGNPAVYLPGASCVINGKSYTPCSSTANTSQRRQLTLKNPDQGQYFATMDIGDDGGTRNYNAMWLQVQRRRAKGITVQANYTLSHCIDELGEIPQYQATNGVARERRQANRGNCDQDTRHNFNMSTVYETPKFANSTLNWLGGGWKISGIVRALSGPQMSVLSGVDTSLTGIVSDRRADQVLADPYGPGKPLDRYLNASAFARPANGSYGNMGRNNIRGPGLIRIDAGVTREFRIREGQTLEFRAEAFNVPNHLNPAPPNLTLNSSTFGKILGAADPRIMQMALKYVF